MFRGVFFGFFVFFRWLFQLKKPPKSFKLWRLFY
nr:MAG TPA: hypothetical protein [Caudoviricetes sp.]